MGERGFNYYGFFEHDHFVHYLHTVNKRCRSLLLFLYFFEKNKNVTKNLNNR